MIDGLKPYPNYKDSGMSWLDHIPAHWGVVRSKRMFSARQELARPNDLQLSATQAYGVIPQSVFEARVGRRVVKISLHLDKRRHVEKDDFVISMRSFQGGLERAWSSGCIRSSYVVLKPGPQVYVGFFAYLFKSADYIRALQSMAGFIRDGQDLNFGDFCSVALPAVPVNEQRLIARFLANADERIRRYIRAKKKLISLLNEQMHKEINRAVTRGVDPVASLKPSGVGWLGDVPQHWQVKRLKWAVRLQRGYDLPSEKRLPGPHPVVSSGGEIGFHSDFRSRGPGVVMGRYGSTDAVFYVERDFWPHNTALFVTDFQGNRPRWCYFLLRTISKADHSQKSAVPGVDRKDLYEIEVPVPPASEQDAIVSWIDAATAIADRAIARMEQEVALLQDYRSRLIADVITGKIDVREVAAHLPDAPATLEDDDLLAEEVAESDAAELDDAKAEVPV
jgi:type I restriction enzyme S subunit